MTFHYNAGQSRRMSVKPLKYGLGRRPLPEAQRLTHFQRTDITREEDRKFRQLAHERGIRPSVLLREVFRSWMKKQ